MKGVRGYILALLSSSTFGTIPLFTLPVLDEGMGVPSVLFYRMFFAASTLGTFLLFAKVSIRIGRTQVPALFGVSGLCYALTSLFLLMSYRYLSSGIATTIHYLYPVTVALLMIFFCGERFSGRLMSSMLLSLCGVALLSWTNNGNVSVPGLLWVLASVVTYAVYIVSLNRQAFRPVDSRVLTFYVLFFSALLFAANALLSGGIEPIRDWRTGFNLFMLGFVCTVVSNLTLVLAVKSIGATLSAVLGTMEPLTAVFIGVLYFQEPFSWRLAAGVALVLAAVLLVILRDRKAVDPVPETAGSKVLVRSARKK